MGSRMRLIAVVLLLSSLMACGTQPAQTLRKSINIEAGAADTQARRLLEQADRAAPPERRRLMLQAAELLAATGDIEWARSIVSHLPHVAATSFVPDESYGRLALINSYIAESDGDNIAAYESVNDPLLLSQLPQFPDALHAAIIEQRAALLFNLGVFRESLEERIELGHLLDEGSPAYDLNSDRIWQALMEFPQEELHALAENTDQPILKGWFSLASLSKGEQSNLREQLASVQHWAQIWPEHPASLRLPADLQLLRELVENQASQIAILLPQTGNLSPAATAVRDGIMAAFYRLRQTEPQPMLRFYNTDRQNINELYDQAIEDGAELIIGPLTKENIVDLALRPKLPVPTLALNNVETPMGRVPNLYQFGLGVEDEAAQTADKIWRDGHRRILLLAPDNNWGNRSVEAFSTMWLALGGTIAGDHRYGQSSEYAKVLKRALQLDESEARASAIRGMVGDIKFEPRRRQDIDAIFLVANATQARQLKPTLAFHYAGNIPVYATSQVYSGSPDPKLDQDMNGIYFTTLPWFFETRSVEKLDLNNYAGTNANFQPLYAFGLDIYYLYPRLRQLESIRSAQFYGQTGTLSMNDDGEIERKQTWARFSRGRIREIRDRE